MYTMVGGRQKQIRREKRKLFEYSFVHSCMFRIYIYIYSYDLYVHLRGRAVQAVRHERGHHRFDFGQIFPNPFVVLFGPFGPLLGVPLPYFGSCQIVHTSIPLVHCRYKSLVFWHSKATFKFPCCWIQICFIIIRRRSIICWHL